MAERVLGRIARTLIRRVLRVIYGMNPYFPIQTSCVKPKAPVERDPGRRCYDYVPQNIDRRLGNDYLACWKTVAAVLGVSMVMEDTLKLNIGRHLKIYGKSG
jgi:hypothetical protein